MPRLTNTMGTCFFCGLSTGRIAIYDYSPPQGGVYGVCAICLPAEAVQHDDGVYEEPKD